MVDIAAVSRLISALKSLNNSDGDTYGGYEKVWEDGTTDRYATFRVLAELRSTLFSLKNLDYWSNCPKTVSEARSTLRDLEGAKLLLEGLSASLEKTVMDIKKHILPFELGRSLASTPDEILSLIFEHLKGNHAKGNLSLVCRQFRRVAVNTPRLWSHISSYNEMPYVRACLQRSKTVGLSIGLYLYTDADFQNALSFVAAVVPHSTRWEDFQACIGKATYSTRIFPFLSNLRLPSLHSLCLTSFSSGDWGDDTGHFYSTWEVPNLRSLDIDRIPKLFEAPKLSSMCLRDVFIYEGNAAKSDRLREFLSAFSGLEELDLELIGRGVHLCQQAQLIEMPNLKHLSIGSPESDTRGISSFMVALRAPKLRKLKIDMLAPVSDDEDFRTLEDLFPHEDYSSVESLTLTMTDREYTQFFIPFGKLRGLRSLSVDSPNLAPYIIDADGDDGFVPALHTLRLSNCRESHLNMLRDLKNALKEQGKWDSFRRLEISSAATNALFGKADELYGDKISK